MRSSRPSLLTLVALFLLAWTSVAWAKHQHVRTTEEHIVIADDWSLVGSLTITRGSVTKAYAIDRMSVAHQLVSCSEVCAGGTAVADAHLAELKKVGRTRPLKVLLAATGPTKELFVAGLWKLDAAEAKALREKSDAEWKKIDAAANQRSSK